jgi:hypothetical protein
MCMIISIKERKKRDYVFLVYFFRNRRSQYITAASMTAAIR